MPRTANVSVYDNILKFNGPCGNDGSGGWYSFRWESTDVDILERALQSNPTINELDIDYANMDEILIERVIGILHSHPNIVKLELYGDSRTEEAIIIRVIQSLPNITYFKSDIVEVTRRSNTSSSPSTSTAPLVLAVTNSDDALSLITSFNFVASYWSKDIARIIGNVLKLNSILNLKLVKIGKQQAEIMEGLCSNTSLQSITVKSSDKDLDVRSLASFLASNTSITRADLGMI